MVCVQLGERRCRRSRFAVLRVLARLRAYQAGQRHQECQEGRPAPVQGSHRRVRGILFTQRTQQSNLVCCTPDTLRQNRYAQTLKSDGIAGLYRGFVVSCVGIVIYRGFYFGLFDTIKPSLPKSIRDNFFANFAVGYGVTVVAGILRCVCGVFFALC